jgi:endo-1,4-beta-D-glucanase Y
MDLTNDNFKGTFNPQEGAVLFPSDEKTVTNTGIQIYALIRF